MLVIPFERECRGLLSWWTVSTSLNACDRSQHSNCRAAVQIDVCDLHSYAFFFDVSLWSSVGNISFVALSSSHLSYSSFFDEIGYLQDSVTTALI